jgi:phosphoribosylaminoimidazole carboxylase PurE protein
MSVKNPVVGVVMGSDSDWEVMRKCVEGLREFGIPCEARILSAHRSPSAVEEYAAAAAERGLKVIVAAAGMSAALAGVIAARTTLPVIGVAMASGSLGGVDALLSTTRMPPGVPVACAGLDESGAMNAAVLAAQILALADKRLASRLVAYKKDLCEKTLAKDRKLQERMK